MPIMIPNCVHINTQWDPAPDSGVLRVSDRAAANHFPANTAGGKQSKTFKHTMNVHTQKINDINVSDRLWREKNEAV